MSFLINQEIISLKNRRERRSQLLSGWHLIRLYRVKPYGVVWCCQVQHCRQSRRLFLLEGNKLQILSLQAFSHPLFKLSLLLHSSPGNCICQHCRENSATCWRTQQIGICLVNTDVFEKSVLAAWEQPATENDISFWVLWLVFAVEF